MGGPFLDAIPGDIGRFGFIQPGLEEGRAQHECDGCDGDQGNCQQAEAEGYGGHGDDDKHTGCGGQQPNFQEAVSHLHEYCRGYGQGQEHQRAIAISFLEL